MIRMLRLLFVLLPALAFVPVAEAGPIVYFDSYRSLNINGTLFENSTTGFWSASGGLGLNRSQSSNIGQTLVTPEGHLFERITASGHLNTQRSGGPENLSTNLFTSFALDVPHTVNLNAFLSTREHGHAEGFFYNETTQMMLAQAAADQQSLRMQYQGLLEPGVYSYYLLAQINTGGGRDGHASFGGDLALMQAAPVPEPATMTLLGVGLAAAWWRRKREFEQ